MLGLYEKKPGQITKRPMPLVWRHWKAEVDGIKRYLAELQMVPPDQRQPWMEKMKTYYRRRLRDLRCYEPPKERHPS